MAETDGGGAPDPNAQGGDGGGSGQGDGGTPPPDVGDGGAGDGGGADALPDFLKAGDDGVPAWMRDQLSPEHRSYVAGKQLASPDDVVKSLMNAERLIGGEKLPAPPKDAKWDDLQKWEGWNRLGVPEKSDAYEVAAPEGREVSDFEKGLHDTMRDAFHEARLNQHQVAILERKLFEHNDQLSQETQQANDRGMKELETEWGGDFDTKVEIGRRAVTTFLPKDKDGNLDDKALQQVERLLGSPTTLRLFHNIGAGIQGDTDLLGGGNPSAGASTATPEGAKAALDKIYAAAGDDPKHPYHNKSHPEHRATVEKVEQLTRIAYPGEAPSG